jgi:hypothetical protein
MFNVTKIPAHLILAGTLVAFAAAIQAQAAVADGPAYFPINKEAGGLPSYVLGSSSAFTIGSPREADDPRNYIQYETEGGVVRIPVAPGKDDSMMKKEQASAPSRDKN